ncbi:MAG: hypothetical protein HOE53_04050 [Candidatus Magasanikbacteria bacterium]|nr:hypothetical protein [Candidatus Magasanikbacteria bacterium]
MKKITVHDSWQDAYTYTCSKGIGRSFDPDFTPELTPKEMLALGIFGGIYMNDKPKEFPPSWFTRAKLSEHSTPSLNYFGVSASLPHREWLRRGWIHPADPRGWFQWYCRYYLGRRMPKEDQRQIKRWRAMKRHVAQVQKNCKKGDLSCRKKQRQALLHWAYDSRTL